LQNPSQTKKIIWTIEDVKLLGVSGTKMGIYDRQN